MRGFDQPKENQTNDSSALDNSNEGIPKSVEKTIGAIGTKVARAIGEKLHDWHSDIKELAIEVDQDLRTLKKDPSKENLEKTITAIKKMQAIMEERDIQPENIGGMPESMVDPKELLSRAKEIYTKERIAGALIRIAHGFGQFDEQNKP
jgi:hypothetical protein